MAKFPTMKQKFTPKSFNNQWYVKFSYCKTCEKKLPMETRFCPDCRLPVRHNPRSEHPKFGDMDSQPISGLK